ncbi:MAG: ABC transporter substrate-binding protein [Rhodobacteraceae bacterium]|jgi:raffinose/stachyose/melibiose transport system substrate-binding protein|nr:ABC transporter substrate-binding protein [Paracoccaceae bacterium]
MTGRTGGRLALAGAFLATALWPQLAGAQDTITLRTWALSGTGIEEFYAAAAESFKATHPNVDIVLEVQDGEAYKTSLQIAVAGSDGPDVFFNWSGEDAQRLIRDGLVLDLTDAAMADGQFGTTLAPGWLNAFSRDGQIYGAPANAVSKYVYYNTGFFAEHALTPPTSFGGLVQLCRDIRAIDPGLVPMPLGNAQRWKMNHLITVINERVMGNDALRADYALTAADEALFTNPGYVTAWEKVLELQEAGCFQDAPNATTPEVSRSMFSSEVSPMIFCGTWCAGIFDSEGYTGYAMFRFPAIEGGASDGNSNMVVPEGLQISAKTAHPQEALAWISHLVSPEVAVKRAELLSAMPSDATLLDQAKVTDQFRWMAADMASLAVQFNVIDVEVEASVANAYLDAGTEILNGTMTPEQAMESIRAAAVAAKAAR